MPDSSPRKSDDRPRDDAIIEPWLAVLLLALASTIVGTFLPPPIKIVAVGLTAVLLVVGLTLLVLQLFRRR